VKGERDTGAPVLRREERKCTSAKVLEGVLDRLAGQGIMLHTVNVDLLSVSSSYAD
jgi:hypothetical protein